MLHRDVATIAASSSPNLVVMHRYQFKPLVWKDDRPVRRTRAFKNMVLFVLFTVCLSGISAAALAGYALLTYLQ